MKYCSKRLIWDPQKKRDYVCMYVSSRSVTYGNVFSHPISYAVCPPSFHLVDHIPPALWVDLSISSLVSLLCFFQQVSNLIFEEIFLHPFFGHVHTKLIVSPKFHQELYFLYIIVYYFIFNLLSSWRSCWYAPKVHSHSQYFYLFFNSRNLTPICGNTFHYCIINTVFLNRFNNNKKVGRI
jgi:hypothetical protein